MIGNIKQKYRAWKRYRGTYDELSRLSNRELADIGIARNDIENLARKGQYQI